MPGENWEACTLFGNWKKPGLPLNKKAEKLSPFEGMFLGNMVTALFEHPDPVLERAERDYRPCGVADQKASGVVIFGEQAPFFEAYSKLSRKEQAIYHELVGGIIIPWRCPTCGR